MSVARAFVEAPALTNLTFCEAMTSVPTGDDAMVVLTALPSPLDDRTVLDPLQCPPLRWGMIGCGRVSHDFCLALKHLPTQSVVACATSSDYERASRFAGLHGIDKAYGSYQAMLDDTGNGIQIVYVGSIHIFRKSVGEACLLANKHVLLEKPFSCSAEDAAYLIQLARERGLFIMEGMWTRFFPIYEQARQLVMEERLLGEVVSVTSDFNFNASDSEAYPDSFFYNRSLGGGAGLLTSPYVIQAATLFFGPARSPDQIRAVGQVDAETGVDLQGAVVLGFPSTSNVAPARDASSDAESTPKLPGAGVALLSYGILGESEEVTTVVGTKGRLTIHSPAHCPTSMTVRLKSKGRGQSGETRHYRFDLPPDNDVITAAGGFYYPNSAGFCYEAAAVARCIAAGRIEVPQYTLDETMVTIYIMDQAREQLGVQPVHE